MNKKLISAVVLLGLLSIGYIALQNYFPGGEEGYVSPSNGTIREVKTFSSKQEFSSYLEESQDSSALSYYGGSGGIGAQPTSRERLDSAAEGAVSGGEGGTSEPSRVSDTNVQVEDIDEADIIKTDGNSIFYSPDSYHQDKTKVLDSLPVENLSITSEIEEKGKLILKDDMLIVIPQRYNEETVYGYDVSEPSSPEKKWEMEINGSVEGARLYDDTIYMVLKEDIDYNDPCPIRPMSTGGREVTVTCDEIYHPSKPIQTDTTYTAFSLNPEDGEVGSRVSFIGSQRNSVVYMSKNAIYASYTYHKSEMKALMDFILESDSEVIPEEIEGKVEKLKGYDISDAAKATEMRSILSNYHSSLNDDERLEFKTKFENAFGNYTIENKRKIQETGIAKISLEGELDISDTGSVPGEPLNQFSMSEYEGDLRIATTIDPYRGESENDVYVLNEDMEVIGSVEGLGKTERIYSVRFINDVGYVVTFRRIDPFYVLDLSEPQNPEMKGELKLPGYSSYLHPLSEDRILGIGEEDGKVKVAIFDVSNPENPELQDTYRLDDYYSEIEDSHHAFLLDKKHEVFFLPGNKGGYVFSYNEKLELEKAVSTENAKRAIYINDYMYIFSEGGVTILNENNWEKVNELEFEQSEERPYPIHKKDAVME